MQFINLLGSQFKESVGSEPLSDGFARQFFIGFAEPIDFK